MTTSTSRKPTRTPARAARTHTDSRELAKLAAAAHRGELVFVFGTGSSMALTDGKFASLSWKGLVESGFVEIVRKGRISEAQARSWQPQLASDDLDDLLGAAEYVGRKLDAPSGDLYARWLENAFKDPKPSNQAMIDAVRGIKSAGVPMCTLNYDGLLESVTNYPPVLMTDVARAGQWMRREGPGGVLHLHGLWSEPSSCVLGIRDYAGTIGDDVRDLFQRSLTSFKHLLFIGCGETFADPNFASLVRWLRSKMKTAAPQHYALVLERDVAQRNADPAWHGFVEPLSYGDSRSDLPSFLAKILAGVDADAERSIAGLSNGKNSAASNRSATLLESYRQFVLRDCGQMTIEGLRADMDTAQRKFDLERLFVPQKVNAVPPEFLASDPDREEKLNSWREKHSKALEFGRTFTKHKRIALLALPGAGKTLLLKRLAVAYADPKRRRRAGDSLPRLDVLPVLLRCREWRDDIRRPIISLFNKIPEVAGQLSLDGIDEVILPLLEQGRILLMVDGLDEIHDDGDRSTFVDNLEAFLDQYKEIRLIVTSREAGFSLVAPCLARFCEQYKLAPLDEVAIRDLCHHWHRLMAGDSPEALAEGRGLAEHLLRNGPVRRLAENPLLLTMLLVVKHGAGRLPPDRVSLYERAVEVLLDTWNIKGHEPLNLKEAVPQLACVAFELLKQGKQTATEKELLALLVAAREKIPQIGRYAKDSPHEFLKRVELRSSLLLEAGRQSEGANTVPFYQFRHLTFQEYLAAFAAAEGHYLEYQRGSTVLTPLANCLLANEWKEVVPMAAVLAKKQADPLIASLVERGEILRNEFEAGRSFAERNEWLSGAMPAPVARLTQCLIEEAEIQPDALTNALRLVALFARGCGSGEDWGALSRGPYGKELYHQAWDLYKSRRCPFDAWIRNTCASLAAHQQPPSHWQSAIGKAELLALLSAADEPSASRGALICVGLLWNDYGATVESQRLYSHKDVEPLLFNSSPVVWEPGAWAWGWQKSPEVSQTSVAALDRLLELWLADDDTDSARSTAGFALSSRIGMPQDHWRPRLSASQVERVRALLSQSDASERDEAALLVAYHSREVLTDEQLLKRLSEAPGSGRYGHQLRLLRQAVEARLPQKTRKRR